MTQCWLLGGFARRVEATFVAFSQHGEAFLKRLPRIFAVFLQEFPWHGIRNHKFILRMNPNQLVPER